MGIGGRTVGKSVGEIPVAQPCFVCRNPNAHVFNGRQWAVTDGSGHGQRREVGLIGSRTATAPLFPRRSRYHFPGSGFHKNSEVIANKGVGVARLCNFRDTFDGGADIERKDATLRD